MEWFELIKWVAGILAGGGFSLGWLFFFRLKRRQLANKVLVDDYKDMQDIVDTYMTRSHDWIRMIDQLRSDLMEAKGTISSLAADNKYLRAQIKDDEGTDTATEQRPV